MPYDKTNMTSFTSGDYKFSKPKYSAKDVKYPTDMKFTNKTKKLDLSVEQYGYVVMEVSYTGAIDFASIVFYDDNGEDVSVGTSLSGLFKISNKNIICENILLNEDISGTKTFYIVVNPNPTNLNRFLTVEVSLGSYVAPSSSSISLSYNCPVPIYSYSTGLHVYSPFDAKPGSTLTTKLYSFVPIESWAVDTFVYCNSRLNNAALPYYYGYGTKIYKVGGELERAFGTRTSYTIRKKLFGKPKITTNTDGPRFFYGNASDTSEACVIPFMEDVGKIKQISATSGFTQPQLYKYYMGYDPTNKRLSNDSVFTKYSLSRSKHDPIVGSTHALEKITQGYVTGYNSSLSVNLWALVLTVIGLAGVELTKETIYQQIESKITTFLLDKLIGPFLEKFIGLVVTEAVEGIISSVLTGIGWALLAYSLYKLLFRYVTVKIEEPCKMFIHHFTTTPYILTGSILYRTTTPSNVNSGYFCDGVYYYQQSGGTVVSKEVSCTNALFNEDPLQFTYQCSLHADNPTLVTDFSKLIVLPYTSGKPVPYCGGSTIYYNTEISQVVTNTCCALETCNSFTVTIPAGLIHSCVSQLDAQTKAQTKLANAVLLAQRQGVYVTPFSDDRVGTLDTHFTHDLKIEDNPTECTIYYDNTVPGATVGKYLYFDSAGCNRVLDGYYAISGTTPYRKFYHTTNGAIDGIYDMTLSSSTTTTTGQPILTVNKDYSSNWYLTGITANGLASYATSIKDDRGFNPNSLYVNPAMKKGFIKTPTTLDNFQLFTNFVSTSYAEALCGTYQPLIDWIVRDPFFYCTARTISLDLLESNYCNDATKSKGFYIIGKYSGAEVSTINEVSLTIRLYTHSAVIITTIKVVTSTSNPRTFVPYGTNVPANTAVKNIEIISIDSPNPQNKISYIKGTVTMCVGYTCAITATISITNPTNPTNNNGSATIIASNGTPPYNFKWNPNNNAVTYTETSNSSSTHPSTMTGNTTYYVIVTDSVGCSKSFTVDMYDNAWNDVFIAKHIILRYTWPRGDDLDTRTRMAVPNIGMDTVITKKRGITFSQWPYNSDSNTDGYVGYKYPFTYPFKDTPRTSTGHTLNILSYAGDNEYSFMAPYSRTEEVYINVDKFKELYPGVNEFTIDCRAFWYSLFVSNAAVQLEASLIKDGDIYLMIENNNNYFQSGVNVTKSKTIKATPKEINARLKFGTDSAAIRGERHATFTYNLITGVGSFNGNDTTTPAP